LLSSLQVNNCCLPCDPVIFITVFCECQSEINFVYISNENSNLMSLESDLVNETPERKPT
jgi:hypothetical protein